MKELTYEDWLENPTPRKMWVWVRDESVKKQYKVVYFSQKTECVSNTSSDR